MRITKVETFVHWAEWCNWLLVRVSTDEGVHGWGECSLHGAVRSVETAVHELAAALVGEDPGGVGRHWQRMYHAWRWRGGATLSSAMAGLDIALWDLEGKRLGVPVYRLLGGPLRERVPVYASHWLQGARTPEQAAEQAREAVRRGFRAFKWSPFRGLPGAASESAAIAAGAELMAAARDAVGPDVDIFVECAEKLSPRTALAAAEAFAPYRPGWFEEPIPFENAAAMAALQQQLPVPIATGERLLSRFEFRELLERGGCRIVQPDVMHAAGITETVRIAAMADTYYVPLAPHNSGGPIATLASLHVAAATPNLLVLEQMEDERPLRDRLCTDPVVYADGQFQLPTGPGLGSDLRLEALAERGFRPQPIQDVSATIWR